jgi:2-haloacid dehalogenase
MGRPSPASIFRQRRSQALAARSPSRRVPFGLPFHGTCENGSQWHRIDTWPDVVPGFKRLQRKFMLAPCSNGNIALMVDVARRNKFSWDAVLGSEIARDFKPKPAVYLMTAAALNLHPEEVMMCAAHSDDLRSAASNGLRAAHIARPGENGPGTGESAPRVPVDFAAKNIRTPDLTG